MTRPCILLIEDDPSTRVALRKILALKGWDVREASTVGEALAKLEPPPDWVILDLMLPGQGGEVLLEKFRNERMEVRVAVCTGVHDPDRLRHVASLQPDAILHKPIDLEQLQALLATGG